MTLRKWGHTHEGSTIVWMVDFWSRVDKTETCWLWLGAKTGPGYGNLVVEGRNWLAHRYSWTITRGPIPEGGVMDHLCRVRHCVNPDHLEVVDHRTNLLRGDTITALAASRTHCPHGHAYDEENTIRDKRGRRCWRCRILADRRRNGYLGGKPRGALRGAIPSELR